MKKDFLIIATLLATIVSLLIINSRVNTFLTDLTPQAVRTTKVEINNLEITAEVATTPQTRSKGLAGRENLAPNSGMLFVFETDNRYKFWMKDVKFPLDIIWIGKDKRIVDISPNAQPEPDVPDNLLRIYQSAIPVKYVLEVLGGTAVAANLRIGDLVESEL